MRTRGIVSLPSRLHRFSGGNGDGPLDIIAAAYMYTSRLCRLIVALVGVVNGTHQALKQVLEAGPERL